MGLSWSRFLNLAYYWVTQNKDQKQLDKFHQEMSRAVNRWNMEILRNDRRVQEIVTAPPQDKESRRGQLPPPPAWWDGENAAQQNILAARQLNSMGLASRR